MIFEELARAQGVEVNGTLDFQDCMDAMARQLSLITGYKIAGTATLKPEFQKEEDRRRYIEQILQERRETQENP